MAKKKVLASKKAKKSNLKQTNKPKKIVKAISKKKVTSKAKKKVTIKKSTTSALPQSVGPIQDALMQLRANLLAR